MYKSLSKFIQKTKFSIACALVIAVDAHAFNVGMMQMQTAGADPIPLAVWYPSDAPEQEWDAGPYHLHATQNAPIAASKETKHSLIILSHGSGGGELGHADLAEALARRGYIVAAGRHLGDSYDQPQGRGGDLQTVGRPWQIVRILDTVLHDPRFAPQIDPERIGMAGFSAGGYTTLVMAGATPKFSLHAEHCKLHEDDRELCPTGANSTRAISRPDWQLPQDHRIRAAVAMAPLSIMFDAQGLSGIRIPLRVYKAQDDELLRNEWNTDRILALMPATVERGTLPGGHYVFLAPCTDALAHAVPAICHDPAGVDRVGLHQTMNREIGDFFDRTLAIEKH